MTHAEKLESLKNAADAAQVKLDKLLKEVRDRQANLTAAEKFYQDKVITRASSGAISSSYASVVARRNELGIAQGAIAPQRAVLGAAIEAYSKEAAIPTAALVEQGQAEIDAQAALDQAELAQSGNLLLAKIKSLGVRNIVIIIAVALVLIFLLIYALKK